MPAATRAPIDVALPSSRWRRRLQRLAIGAMLAAGAALLLAALLSSERVLGVAFSAAAGTATVGIAIAAAVEDLPARSAGMLAFAIGAACALSALVSAEGFGHSELARLVGGCTIAISGLALLPGEPDVGPATRRR